MMGKPELSVVMPFYNSARYIKGAVQSLLAQTYQDFELILIDDASTDQSPEIVMSLNDSRIKLIRNEKNSGIVFSRNRGLEASVGRFLAAFDSDDLARADKFEKQIRFLKNNPEYGMVGSWAKLIDENGGLLNKRWKLTASPGRIPTVLLFNNHFVHSAVVMRREEMPEKFYAEGFDLVEDYKMWIDFSRTRKVWNFPDYLMYYRIHPESATNINLGNLYQQDVRIYKYLFEPLQIKLDERMIYIHLIIKDNNAIDDRKILNEIEAFLWLIIRQNEKTKVYNHTELIKVIFGRWVKVCYKSRKMKSELLKIFMTSRLLRTYLKTVL